MQMRRPADGPDLTVAECTSYRQAWHQLACQADVSIGMTEEPLTSSQACHEESEMDRLA